MFCNGNTASGSDNQALGHQHVVHLIPSIKLTSSIKLTTIDVDHQGDWNTIRAAPQLHNLSQDDHYLEKCPVLRGRGDCDAAHEFLKVII